MYKKLGIILKVGRYINEDFFNLFCMTSETFNIKMSVVNNHNKSNVRREWQKAVLMTIWCLEKQKVLFSVADRFKLAVSTVYNETKICAGFADCIKIPVNCLAIA